MPAVATDGWHRVGSRSFSVLVPPGYSEVEADAVDSALHAWEGPGGGRVDADHGMYTGHFLRQAGGPMKRRIAICNAALDGRWPQLVLYETHDDRFAAGLWWPVPGGRIVAEPEGRLRVEALWLTATSPDSADLPALLGIVRSARLR